MVECARWWWSVGQVYRFGLPAGEGLGPRGPGALLPCSTGTALGSLLSVALSSVRCRECTGGRRRLSSGTGGIARRFDAIGSLLGHDVPVQFGETTGALPRNQSLKTNPDKGRLLRNTRQPRSLRKKRIIYIECRSHMHKYALIMHIMSNKPAD